MLITSATSIVNNGHPIKTEWIWHFNKYIFTKNLLENNCIATDVRSTQFLNLKTNLQYFSTVCYNVFLFSGKMVHFSFFSQSSTGLISWAKTTSNKIVCTQRPKKRSHYISLLTRSQCLNQFAWFSVFFNAVLFWTHLLTLYSATL